MGVRQHLEGLGKEVARNVCKVCGTSWPVEILARDCEQAHAEDETVA